MLRHKREIVFTATIEYHQYNDVKRNIRKDKNMDGITYEKLEKETRRVLCEDLPADLEKIYGVKANIRHIESREGSLTVFFAALISTYGFIANYKDFLESVQLIKKHAKRLLVSLVGRLNEDMRVDVDIDYPECPHPDSIRHGMKNRILLSKYPPEFIDEMLETECINERSRPRRDSFFWYLIISNIALISLIAIFVAKAVENTYFR